MKLVLQSAAVACRRLCLLVICILASAGLAQQVQAPRAGEPIHPAITLEPASGSELQAHVFDSKGNRLPEAPANFRRLGEARVGELAAVHTLTLRFAENTRLTAISAGNDFRVEKGGSCEAGNAYAKDTVCTVLVRFTPQGSGNRLGHLSVSTSTSATPMAFGLGGFGYSPIASFVPAVISTVPGSFPSNVGLLSGAQNLTVDGGDTLWVSDTANGLVRYLNSDGTFKTLASGYPGLSGIAVDTFGQAYFDVPSTGTMYEIYDYGPVVQVTGTGTANCPASAPCTLSSEGLGTPGEMSMDPYNHLFFVDSHAGAAFSTVQPIPANLVFLYDPFPFQQNPTAAMAVDASDNLYSLWSNGAGVCEIVQQSLYGAENSSVNFTKIAGGHTCGFNGDGGIAGNAEIGNKVGQIAFDAAGDLYFSDQANQRVRRIDYATGVIRTIAGKGVQGYTGDGLGAPGAELDTPTGVGVDSTGSVYIISSAASGQVIRKVGPNGILNFNSQGKGTPSAPKQSYLTNTGNSTMTLSGYSISGTNAADFKVSPANTTCNLNAGGTLSAGQTCQIGVIFTPSAPGPRTAKLMLADNTIGGFNTVLLTGTGVKPVPTIAITSPTAGSSFKSGTDVTLSASVTSTSGPAPTGKVQFKVDGANFGAPVTLSGGVATTSVTGLTQKAHTLGAFYNGDAVYATAGPATVSIAVTAVKIGSFVSLARTAAPSTACSPAQFAIKVSSASGPVPTGNVALFKGTTRIASGSLLNGAAHLTAPPMGAGSHSLSASYSGDSLHLPAESPTFIQPGSPTATCSPTVAGNAVRSPTLP